MYTSSGVNYIVDKYQGEGLVRDLVFCFENGCSFIWVMALISILCKTGV